MSDDDTAQTPAPWQPTGERPLFMTEAEIERTAPHVRPTPRPVTRRCRPGGGAAAALAGGLVGCLIVASGATFLFSRPRPSVDVEVVATTVPPEVRGPLTGPPATEPTTTMPPLVVQPPTSTRRRVVPAPPPSTFVRPTTTGQYPPPFGTKPPEQGL